MIMRRADISAWLRWIGMLGGLLAIAAALVVVADWRTSGRSKIAYRAHPYGHEVDALLSRSKPIADPMKIAAVTPEQARASNAKVSFVNGAVVPALPFTYGGTPADRVAAEACLAAAAYYEAGDETAGERAVAQVVMNRLRHPAFPKTVCGVVFAGAERRTGCQFTFACDGSLSRMPPQGAWTRALAIANAALSGFVDKTIGLSTYYHADYVVPYWRDTLDKVAVVRSQIFYRWRGYLGRPIAFSGQPTEPEVIDPRIIPFVSPLTTLPLADDEMETDADVVRTSLDVSGVPRAALKGSIVRLKDDEAGQYVLQLPPSGLPNSFPVTAFTICADKRDCMVFAWKDERDVPRSLPVLPIAMRSLAFMYHKSSITEDARPFWDCRRYPRALKGQCLPGT